MGTRELTPRERLLAVSEALARLDAAVASLVVANNRAEEALPNGHPASLAVGGALETARVAKSKLELVFRRLP